VAFLNILTKQALDAKLVAVPHEKLSKEYAHIQDVKRYSTIATIQIIEHFSKKLQKPLKKQLGKS